MKRTRWKIAEVLVAIDATDGYTRCKLNEKWCRNRGMSIEANKWAKGARDCLTSLEKMEMREIIAVVTKRFP